MRVTIRTVVKNMEPDDVVMVTIYTTAKNEEAVKKFLKDAFNFENKE